MGAAKNIAGWLLGDQTAARRQRRRAAFKQGDVTRAARAALAAGLDIQGIEIGIDGKITMVVGKPPAGSKVVGGGQNDWSDAK